MFKRPAPRVYGLPPGADFPKALLDGLLARLPDDDPMALSQVEIFVNTRRMHRRLMDLLAQGPARLLPRIRLLSEISEAEPLDDLPPPVPALRRQLDLSQLISKFLEHAPDLAPKSAAFDLARDLVALQDELHSEGVAFSALTQLDLSHLSAHWDITRQFLEITQTYSDAPGRDPESRNRIAAERLIARWQKHPPQHPIVLAGSTGSRGTTALLMQAVAQLPKGAVVLPGFDFDQTEAAWEALASADTAEDHPQFRFLALMQMLDRGAGDVAEWLPGTAGPAPARNKILSLALRPAPVTDQWQTEGRDLRDIAGATQNVTIVEAPSPRAEAMAIALCMRAALESGISCALISPDRMLTRQVTAALDRWGIEPDDSAGNPLHHSPPGRMLLQVAGLFGRALTADQLIALLKHPLCSTGGDTRGYHLLWTREIELHLRRHGPAYPTPQTLRHLAEGSTDGRARWVEWLIESLFSLNSAEIVPFLDHLTLLRTRAETLSAGRGETGSGELWDKEAGKQALLAIEALEHAGAYGGDVSPSEFQAILRSVLSEGDVKDPLRPNPGIMIWGTLEARVQGADLVILGGLNEGSWPKPPKPDPWLSRDMRRQVGLLSPERQIGLSAHDFQQAAAANEVVLTRAIRDADSETVPARWLNRITNLLGGLPKQGGQDALRHMRARGDDLLQTAAALEAPNEAVAPAPRPAPCPPVALRPKQLSVTRIQTLIRDPYSIYAERILQLRPLDPLHPQPDAPMRGTILHRVLESFLQQDHPLTVDAFLANAEQIIAETVPWAATQRLWLARLNRVAHWFVSGEVERQKRGHPIALETKGGATLASGFRITATADRIDQRDAGTLEIFDYKTGAPPSPKQIEKFDKQLLLEAAIAERGGFDDVAPAHVAAITHIGLGSVPKLASHSIDDDLIGKTWAGLDKLIESYGAATQGYTARRAIFKREDTTPYDQLSRYGEWDETQPASQIEVGQ